MSASTMSAWPGNGRGAARRRDRAALLHARQADPGRSSCARSRRIVARSCRSRGMAPGDSIEWQARCHRRGRLDDGRIGDQGGRGRARFSGAEIVMVLTMVDRMKARSTISARPVSIFARSAGLRNSSDLPQPSNAAPVIRSFTRLWTNPWIRGAARRALPAGRNQNRIACVGPPQESRKKGAIINSAWHCPFAVGASSPSSRLAALFPPWKRRHRHQRKICSEAIFGGFRRATTPRAPATTDPNMRHADGQAAPVLAGCVRMC